MSKLAIIALKAVGGSALFTVSFVGFAKINGVPLNTLPGIGRMFPAAVDEKNHANPTELVEAGAQPATAETHKPEAGVKPENPVEAPVAKPASETFSAPKEVHAGIFDLLDADGLYTQDELRALAESLRQKNHEADQRGAELDRREDLLADRLNALDDRRRVLDDFAKQLDARDRELKARATEVNRDSNSGNSADGKNAAPVDMAAFFAEGDTEVLVKRLTGYSVEECARILVKLPPARAMELLDAMPSARWREYAEAYARAAQKPPP